MKRKYLIPLAQAAAFICIALPAAAETSAKPAAAVAAPKITP